MPLAARHRKDPLPALAPLAGLVVHRETSAAVMATLQARTETEMLRRFAQGHRAYVALVDGAPAAWGWSAAAVAEIGETGTLFEIPRRERYLWNFVTLASHRGLGIYPRLLDAIVAAESGEADVFWVAYAPENHASGAGIAKAGFTMLAELSFDASGRPAVAELFPGGGAAAGRLLGLPEASGALAPCWRCVRMGRESMACATGRCQCDYQKPKSGCAA